MPDLILSLDQSTTATKAILFDTCGKLLHRFNQPHQQYYPQPGWVEHDPDEIWQNTLAAIAGVWKLSGLDVAEIPRRVRVLTVTNQRETIMIWDRETGRPIHRAISWQCGRAAAICQTIRERGLADRVKERSGLVLSPYFSAAKAAWLLDQVPGARAKANDGKLLLGTMDCWLVWKLTGGAVHTTDFSNASRTQLFNLVDKRWDDELLAIFNLPASLLPDVRCSDEVVGHVAAGSDPRHNCLAGLPIAGIIGDSHAALFGQNCFEQGMTKATYGTGSSIMMNIGNRPQLSDSGLVTSIAWGRQKRVDYVLEGNINCTGATITWLINELELINNPREAGEWASRVPDNGGVYLVPAFVGLGAPYWDSDARASITGMTRATGKAHVVRAAEESIAYQVKDIVNLMLRDSDLNIPELRVDGGPIRDEFLMQFQADMLDIPIACAQLEELSALGSCLMGGLAVGVWHDLDEIRALRLTGRTYQPALSPHDRERLYAGWREAVSRTLSR